MSVALYDKAFLHKLKKITEKTNIHLLGVDDSKRLFEMIADETLDKPIELPIVSLRRQDCYTIKEIGNNARSKTSMTMAASIEDNSGIRLNTIPISINYQIDVYTRKFIEADDIMRELVFILTNSPQLSVIVPYNSLQYEHKSNITLSTTVRDNSAIPEHLINGQFTRLTLDCSIADAYLFDTRVLQGMSLSIKDLVIVNTNNNTYTIEPLDINHVDET